MWKHNLKEMVYWTREKRPPQKLKDGSIYDGDWCTNPGFEKLKMGRCEQKWPDGTFFEGWYIEGGMAEGRLFYPNGNVYVGSFLNN